MAHDVFISYAAEDRQIADTVCRALEEGGVACWYAPRDVPLSVNYEEAIVEAVGVCRLVVLILSSHANNSPHVQCEIQLACAEKPPKPILPVRVESLTLNKVLRYYLSSAQWLDASTPPVESHLPRLVGQLRARLSQAGAVGAGSPGRGAEARRAGGDEPPRPDAADAPRTKDEEPAAEGVMPAVALVRVAWGPTAWILLTSSLLAYAVFLAIARACCNDLPSEFFKERVVAWFLILMLVELLAAYVYLRWVQSARRAVLAGILAVVVAGFSAAWGVHLTEVGRQARAAAAESWHWGSVRGKVTFEGRGVPNAHVTLQPDFHNGVPTQTATTDEAGVYSFPKIPQTHYSISVSEPGYEEWREDLLVPQEGTEIDIELKRAGSPTENN